PVEGKGGQQLGGTVPQIAADQRPQLEPEVASQRRVSPPFVERAVEARRNVKQLVDQSGDAAFGSRGAEEQRPQGDAVEHPPTADLDHRFCPHSTPPAGISGPGLHRPRGASSSLTGHHQDSRRLDVRELGQALGDVPDERSDGLIKVRSAPRHLRWILPENTLGTAPRLPQDDRRITNVAVYLLNSNEEAFPPAERADADGLLAVGGDLKPRRLLAAYARGIFPWYSEGLPILWPSPDPRFVLRPERIHLSRSLKKTIKHARFEVRYDTAFDQVIDACARQRRPAQRGTWITRDM